MQRRTNEQGITIQVTRFFFGILVRSDEFRRYNSTATNPASLGTVRPNQPLNPARGNEVERAGALSAPQNGVVSAIMARYLPLPAAAGFSFRAPYKNPSRTKLKSVRGREEN